MSWSDILNTLKNSRDIILGLLTVLGATGTFYFGFRARSLRKEIRTFSWHDIHTAARSQMRAALKEFHPGIIVTMSGPGAIVANIAMQEEPDCYLPIFMIDARHLHAPEYCVKLSDRYLVSTSRWMYYIPENLFQYKDTRILLFDDCVVTGDTLHMIVNLFIEKGFSKENIRTAALVTTEIALQSAKGPDFYTYVVPDGNFYMPWGRGLGKGYNLPHGA